MSDAHWIVNTSLSYSSPYPYVAVGPLTACTSDLCGFYDLANHDVVSASDLNSALSHTADLFPDSGFKASFYTWDIPSLLLILVMLIPNQFNYLLLVLCRIQLPHHYPDNFTLNRFE